MVYFAHRARASAPGIPERFALLVRELSDQGSDIVDLGFGGPHRLPAPHVLASLVDGCRADDAFRYPMLLPSLPEAIARWYNARFNVSLDREEEILPVWGNLEGLLPLPLAFLEPGDGILVPDPGSPMYMFLPTIVNALPIPYPLVAANNFLPDFDGMDALMTPRIRALILQLPANPTGAAGSRETMASALAFCQKHDLVLVHDNSLGEMTAASDRAPSIMEIPGARDRAVEYGSFTHTFNMAGTRLGYFVGGRELITALGRTRGPFPIGPFLPIQRAAIHALTHGDRDTVIASIRATYQERRDTFLRELAKQGWSCAPSRCLLYVWAPVPGNDDDAFALFCLNEAGVAVAPGRAFGSQGQGYVRMALGKEELPRMITAAERLGWALERWRSS